MINKYFEKLESLKNLKKKLGYDTKQFNSYCLGLSNFEFN